MHHHDTDNQRARLHELARQRARALRDEAIADFWHATAATLTRMVRWATQIVARRRPGLHTTPANHTGA